MTLRERWKRYWFRVKLLHHCWRIAMTLGDGVRRYHHYEDGDLRVEYICAMSSILTGEITDAQEAKIYWGYEEVFWQHGGDIRTFIYDEPWASRIRQIVYELDKRAGRK